MPDRLAMRECALFLILNISDRGPDEPVGGVVEGWVRDPVAVAGAAAIVPLESGGQPGPPPSARAPLARVLSRAVPRAEIGRVAGEPSVGPPPHVESDPLDVDVPPDGREIDAGAPAGRSLAIVGRACLATVFFAIEGVPYFSRLALGDPRPRDEP